jgi:hypothetical protein
MPDLSPERGDRTMEWVEVGIRLVGFAAELLIGLAGTQDGSSPGLTGAARRSAAMPGGARKEATVLNGSTVPESMNRWAVRQDVELRAAMFARSKAGWRSSEAEPTWSPIPATSSTSDPMWDRELDG